MTKKTKSRKAAKAKKPAKPDVRESIKRLTKKERAQVAASHHSECEDPSCGGCSKAARAVKRHEQDKADAAAPTPAKPRDPRLPAVGSHLTRVYHEKSIEVDVKDDGFWHEGECFKSLSALASKLAGSAKNGLLWFGLTKRPAPAAAAETVAPEKGQHAGGSAKRSARKAKTARAARDPAPESTIVDQEPADEGVDAESALAE